MNLRALMTAALAALLLAVHAQPAGAAPSTSTVTPLPPLTGASGETIITTVDGNPVVIDRDGRRAFAFDGRAWAPIDARQVKATGVIVAAASDGQRVVLLTGPNGVARNAGVLVRSGNALGVRPLASLALPLVDATAAVTSDALLVAGIAPDGRPRLFRLAWSSPNAWQVLAVWPGGAAPVALAAQNGGIFVTDANQRQWRWLKREGWRPGAAPPGSIVPGSARAAGQAYLLYLVRGADGARLYSYSAITDAWAPLGAPLPGDPVAAAPRGDGIVWAARGKAGLDFSMLELKSARQSLALIDWAIIGAYLFAMLGIGLTFYRRAKKGPSAEFFLGSRSIPAWAAGISMFAGSISSISYLAVPAKAFETNWEYIMSKIMTVCGLVFVAMVVVPVFRRLNLVSVFNYLEERFHPAIRLLSSALWILMQVGGRMGIVLYLPALAIGTITDTNIVGCIIVVGLFTIVYTALGGMRAVVWTDVFQVLVLTAGAFFAIGFVLYSVGLGPVWTTAAAFDKTRMLNFSFDVTQPTVWAFLLLALFDVVLTFPKDQVLMQRVLATPSEKAAGRSVWLFAAVLLPSAFMFYIIGTVLFAYYRVHPAQLNPALPIDTVFPQFIGSELPHGVVGIILAGLIAAAMGTLSGIINSVATLL
ncbi:MAG: sodium:solute symporter, partial [Proteobacteria bacterium]|nr:sodium:solute symporter [Pseudomonadota bacterium]